MTEKNSGKVILQAFLIIIAAFLAAGVLTALISMVTYNSDPAVSVSRIIVSVILLVIFRKYLDSSKAFTGLKYILPGLAIVIWNIIMNLMTGGQISLDWPVVICLGSFAPALFEEVLFRMIFINKMRSSGVSAVTAMIIPAVCFGLIHLTNALSGDIVNALIQTCYATVIGLLLGAIYIKSGDLISVILLHWMIDASSQIFTGGGTGSPVWLVLMAVLLAGEVFYAFRLAGTFDKSEFTE